MSGWVRVGIVLSVIWFVGFGAFLWVDSINNASSFQMWQGTMCKAILDTDNSSLQYLNSPAREQKEKANWEKYRQCLDRASEGFTRAAEDLKASLPMLLGVDALLLGVWWLLAVVVIAISRWIRRGFATGGST